MTPWYSARRMFLALLVVCLGSGTLVAQRDTLILRHYFGAYAGAAITMHSTSFGQLPGIPSCCIEYTGATAIAPALGVFFEVPLADMFTLQTRLGFTSLSGSLQTDEVIGNEPVLRDGPIPVGERRSITVNHTLDATLPLITLEPTVGINPFDKFWVYVGGRAGYLISSNFEQRETLVSPDGYVFAANGSTVRNEISGAIPNASKLQLHASIGLAYSLPLGPSLELLPEVRYQFPITKISDVQWKVSQFQVGAMVRYGSYRPRDPIIKRDTVYRRDTSVVAKPTIAQERIYLKSSDVQDESRTEDWVEYHTITIHESYVREVPRVFAPGLAVTATMLDAQGRPVPVTKIRIEETDVIETFPLLHHIFFTENSSDITTTQLSRIDPEDTKDFRATELVRDQLDVYKNMLNIVGSRMRSNPKATIKLIGCTSNTGPEANNKTLARARAEAVRDYLSTVWGIDPARMSVEARLLPSSPANNQYVEGREENQRVEIESNDPLILETVEFKDRERAVTPKQITFDPSVTSSTDISKWSLNVTQQQRALRDEQGSGVPNRTPWNLDVDPKPNSDQPVVATYTVFNDAGQQSTAQVRVPVEVVTAKTGRSTTEQGKLIERYSLIMFEYNSAELNQENKAILERVKSRVQPETRVRILGYADRTGNPEYNRELARKRCVEVQRKLDLPAGQVSLEPIGSDRLLYPNDTPSGRSYSRTVQIELDTPIK
ncbi:MAG: OmpA family protein [Bacteroidetes bacterium]|nr:OmpA family protein [Bacteroidota bacterium]